MKKVLFLVSHLESGSTFLFDHLDSHQRIHGFRPKLSYSNPIAYRNLVSHRHKLDTSAAIWMDELLFNYEFSWKPFYDECNFVYLLREPTSVLGRIMRFHRMSPENAMRHYCYRLRRICEMAKRTPGAVLLTWSDLREGRGLDLVADYLSLRTPFPAKEYPTWGTWSELIPAELMRDAENRFEQRLFFLKNQDLRFCSRG